MERLVIMLSNLVTATRRGGSYRRETCTVGRSRIVEGEGSKEYISD